MLIHEALKASADEAGLNATQIAARVGRSEMSARQYMSGAAVPPGDIVVRLMREVPGFATKLGFEAVTRAA